MLHWLAENSDLAQVILGAVTAAVWLVYLQILVSGLRRQRRTEILIYLGGGRHMSARVFVSNLGFEPVYILDILLALTAKGAKSETSVVVRTELNEDDLTTPSQVTMEGPLKSGEFVDIGSVADVVGRARGLDREDLSDVTDVALTVAACSSGNYSIVAARRHFRVERRDGQPTLIASSLYARQIRAPWNRRRIARRLEAALSA